MVKIRTFLVEQRVDNVARAQNLLINARFINWEKERTDIADISAGVAVGKGYNRFSRIYENTRIYIFRLRRMTGSGFNEVVTANRIKKF